MIELFALALLFADGPILDPAKDQPPPPNTVLYTDCFQDSIERGTVKAQNGFILFNCQGAPAQRFHDRIAALPDKKTHVETVGARTLRYTSRPQKDTDGLDACWRDTAAAGSEAEYGCRIIFKAAEFLYAK